MNKNSKYITYAFGKFSEAFYQLAIGMGDIKSRLLAASDKFWAVDPEMLPPHIKNEMIWVQNQLMRFPPVGNEGEVQATIRRIHWSTCVKIAERVIYIHSLLESELKLQ